MSCKIADSSKMGLRVEGKLAARLAQYVYKCGQELGCKDSTYLISGRLDLRGMVLKDRMSRFRLAQDLKVEDGSKCSK